MRLMAREVQSYAQRFVVSGEARGELDHPLPTSRVFKHINARNVSHIFLELWWAGNELCATVQVLNTPSGQLVRRLYLNGERVAFASRGWATLREDVASGVTIVEDDFLLITFDCVRVGALGDLFKPVVGRCAAAAPARLLAARASFWAQLHSDTRPLWPFAPASRAHLYENWMVRVGHADSSEHEATHSLTLHADTGSGAHAPRCGIPVPRALAAAGAVPRRGGYPEPRCAALHSGAAGQL
jgi:hypothetical protein